MPSPTRRSWTLLVLLSIAQFMVVLDITAVNVALPSIGADLGFAPADLQWVVTAYVLMTGGLLLLGGRAADVLGRRTMFLAGLGVFTTASLASGLAPSADALIASRAAQGLGAALLTPAALSIVTTTYTGAQRATALATWGAIASAGAGLGVVLGGLLTSWLSWQWVFLVNVPVGIAAAVLALRLIPASARAARAPLDLPGALSVVGGLGLLVYAIQGTADHGWSSARTLVLLAIAAGLLATFALVERSVRQPILPPATWRRRSLVSGAIVMFGATGVLTGTFFLSSLYLQNVLGQSALESGLQFLPLVVAIGIAAHLAPHALAHAGSRAVAVGGLLLMAAGSALLAFAPDQASYAADLLPGMIVVGFGTGLVLPAAQVTGMSDVGHLDAGLASGLMSTAHELGAAFGVAVLAAVAAGSSTFPIGFGDAFVVAAAVAGALAVAASLTVPAIRPAGEVRAALH